MFDGLLFDCSHTSHNWQSLNQIGMVTDMLNSFEMVFFGEECETQKAIPVINLLSYWHVHGEKHQKLVELITCVQPKAKFLAAKVMIWLLWWGGPMLCSCYLVVFRFKKIIIFNSWEYIRGLAHDKYSKLLFQRIVKYCFASTLQHLS